MQDKKVKIGAIIQARSNSTRLPGKGLLPLPINGSQTVIDHIIDRAKSIFQLSQIVLATTTDNSDDAIVEVAARHGIKVFRGSEKLLLERILEAAEQNGLEVFARLNGDNPCLDPEIVTNVINEHVNQQVEYTITEGLPLGLDAEIFSTTALRKVMFSSDDPERKETVNKYIRFNPRQFKIHKVSFAGQFSGDLRVTLDYPSDYAFINLIYNKLYFQNREFGIEDIEKLIASYPWMKSINADNYQKKQFKDLEEEIYMAAEFLNKFEFKNAATLLLKEYLDN